MTTTPHNPHLGPECLPDNHIWLKTEHGHDICVTCKVMRPTPKSGKNST